MGSFERMWAKVPDTLKSESSRKIYEALAEIFEDEEKKQEPYIYTQVMSQLKNEMLDEYGMDFGVYRNSLNDEAYKRKIKVEQFKRNFVPTWNNFIGVVKFVTGYEVNAIEGWKLSPPQKAMLQIEITIPAGSDDTLLDQFKELYSAGVKINWIVRQESYIPFELIGEHNKIGNKQIYRSKERILDEV